MASAVVSLSKLKEDRPIFEVMVLSFPSEEWEFVSEFYQPDSLNALIAEFQPEAIGADFQKDSAGFIPRNELEKWILGKTATASLGVFSTRPREIAAQSFEKLKLSIDSLAFAENEFFLKKQSLFTENVLLDSWESINSINNSYTDNQLFFLYSLKNKALGIKYERGINRWTGFQVRNTIKYCVEHNIYRVLIVAPLEESFYLRKKFSASRKIKLVRP